MDWISDPQIWIALATLTFLEIVLGVDNIIFISILSGKLPPAQQPQGAASRACSARSVTRILLLFSLAWIDPADRAAVHGHRHGDLGPRSDPDPRRPVPARQEHARDSRQARRARTSTARRRVAASFTQRDHPDHAPRHRLLAGLGDHRRRHGRRALGDGDGGHHRDRHHDAVGRAHQRVRAPPSDGQDAGAQLPAADRRCR